MLMIACSSVSSPGFGMAIYMRLKTSRCTKACWKFRTDLRNLQDLPVDPSKFLMLLWLHAAIIVLYFGVLRHFEISRVMIILVFSLWGIAGS